MAATLETLGRGSVHARVRDSIASPGFRSLRLRRTETTLCSIQLLRVRLRYFFARDRLGRTGVWIARGKDSTMLNERLLGFNTLLMLYFDIGFMEIMGQFNSSGNVDVW